MEIRTTPSDSTNHSQMLFLRRQQSIALGITQVCDASEKAYAGVVYLRSSNQGHDIQVSLVMARTKVSPIKQLSIPRLEFCGAVVVTRLLKHVSNIHQLPPSKTFAWTDSSIVLHWLSGNPKRFKMFVGNRVAEITAAMPPNRWRHVPSEHNPADCASRGLLPSELIDHQLWWKEPHWLMLESSRWPELSVLTDPPPQGMEMCLVASINVVELVVPSEHYSNYARLVRVTAWLL